MFRTIHKKATQLSNDVVRAVACVFVCVFFGSFVPDSIAGGVGPVETKVVKVYPNPAVSYVNFEFSDEIDKSCTLIIYSFVGKKMLGIAVSSSKMTILLTNYYRGVYIYQLKDKTGKVLSTGKFQVNE